MQINAIHFETIDSTNTWAKTHFDEFPRDSLTVVTADEQTAGRGRWRRKWVSPKAVNLLVSYAFYLDLRRPDIGNIPQILSLSAANTLRKFDIDISIKWPNDLQVNKKKIGGILCETVSSGTGVGVIVGIGINVNMEKNELGHIDIPATSMKAETGKVYDRNALLAEMTQQYQKDLQVFLKHGFTPFYPDYLAFSSLSAGNRITVHIHPQKYPGHFHSLNEDGSLTYKSADGSLQTVHSGEIIE